ncbi:Ig-like domain-containing protein [Patescibacteria group bacterium]
MNILNNDFKDRKVDKAPVKKSKEYLWKYIQQKTGLEKAPAKSKKAKSGGNFFASLFMPKKIAWASVVAVLVIVAIVFGPNLQNLLQSGFISGPPTVSAHFEMTADNQDSSGIESDTSFTLIASEDLDAAAVEANIKVTPDTDLNVTKIEEGKYKVQPANGLEPNAIYNFVIVSETDEGPKGYSWAYQVKDTFKVTGSLPADKTSGIPTNSGIEFTFSHEQLDVEHMFQYFEISPEVQGTFEHHQRTVSFVPQGGLDPATIYTVTLKAGLPLLKSDQTLLEDYTVQFETAEGPAPTSSKYFSFSKDYYEVSSAQPLAMTVYTNLDDTPVFVEIPEAELEFDEEGNPIEIEIPEPKAPTVDVEVYKFSDVDKYIEALEERENIPYWASLTRSQYDYKISDLEKIATFEAEIGEEDWRQYIHMPSAELSDGYYLFKVNTDDDMDQALVQMTDLSAFISATATDAIVWTHDLSAEKPATNATVEVIGESISTKTDNNGVARFDFPQENHSQNTIKITAADGKSIVTQVVSRETQKSYWYAFDTDRPMYLPNDKMRFWGFVDPKDGSQIEDMNMKLYKGWGGYLGFAPDAFVSDLSFEAEADGTFSGSYDFEEMLPGSYVIAIYDGEKTIGSKAINVRAYTKPTYDIEVTPNKRAMFSGEEIKIDIDTHFFDGTPVPYVELNYGDSDGTALVTDENGKAVYTQKAAANYEVDTKYFSFYPTKGESSDIYGSVSIAVYRSHIDVDAKKEVKDNTAYMDIQTNWIDLTKINENEGSYSYRNHIGDIAGNRKVKGIITEKWWNKIETGEHYDFINKKVVKDYDYRQASNEYGTFDVVTDDDGVAHYEFEMDPSKYYTVKFETYDDDGGLAEDNLYIYGSESSRGRDYYSMKILNNDDGEHYFDVGESVETAFTQSDTPLSVDVGGQFLFMQLQNGLHEHVVKESPYYTFKFEKEDVPNIYLQGVWFDGKMYRTTFSTSVSYNKELKGLDVELETNKDSYEPGEKVTLNVTVKDKDGNPVATKINMNLVDEAYYKLIYNRIQDPIEQLYSRETDGIIQRYVTHTNPLDTANLETGAEAGGCFTAGTQILMSDGTYKSIEEVAKGDYILTRKHAFSNELVASEVTSTISHYVNEYLVINDSLEVTREHVLFVNNMWDVAGNVRIGDYLTTKEGNNVKVTSIKKVNKPTWVYNFEVKDQHTYIANNFYVHNDKGGDGVRNDFEDTALFETITTGSNGKGSVTFQVPDNITSWRVVAKAIDTQDLRAGVGIGSVKVTLPMFADLVMNKEYSIKDNPILKFRAFGNALSKDDEVDFNLTATSLGVEKSDTITGTAFTGSYYELPELKLGTHDIQIDAKAGSKKDAISLPMEVKGSRLKHDVLELIPSVDETTVFDLPEEGFAEIYFMDTGLTRHYQNLLWLYFTEGERIDQRLSEVISREILAEHFEVEYAQRRDFEITNYQQVDGGLSLIPYSSSDLRLSALITTVDPNPERYNTRELKKYFNSFYNNPDANFEEVILAMLGLANMNEPVLNSLQIIKDDETLTLTEKLYIALAFESLGDHGEARKIYNKVSDELADDNAYETALGAILAAGLGEKDDAIELYIYVERHGIKDDILNLYEIGYIKNAIEYASPDEVSFTVRPGNSEEQITLKPCGTHKVLASKMKGISLTDVKGDLGAVIYYEEPIAPENFETDSSVNISRSYTNLSRDDSTYQEGDIVKITLALQGDKDTSYLITDIMPSGLKLLTAPKVFGSYYGNASPYNIHNQEVYFYWFNGENSKPYRTYYATVIHPGTFYADPAKIESFLFPEVANITSGDKITIER